MIATVSPGASSADHTINTLRYADRIKENKVEETPIRKSRPTGGKVTIKNEMKECSLSPPAKEVDDLDILHNSLKGQNSEEGLLYTSNDERNAKELAQFHRTVQSLFEEEENLLNFHMSVIQVMPYVSGYMSDTIVLLISSLTHTLFYIPFYLKFQENAELLTEEGKLLQGVQCDGVIDYDIDTYASRLGTILDRKTYLIAMLKEKLGSFRAQLQQEEELSKKVSGY